MLLKDRVGVSIGRAEHYRQAIGCSCVVAAPLWSCCHFSALLLPCSLHDMKGESRSGKGRGDAVVLMI